MTSPSEKDVASRFHEHRADIIRYLPVSLTELAYEWLQAGLIETEEIDFYLNELRPREEKIQRFLTSLEQKVNGYSKFLQCILRLKCHLGHVYIASLLENQHFADDTEIINSAAFRHQIIHNASVMKNINLEALSSILFENYLITMDEFTSLTHRELDTERNLRLIQILDTKGPTAHSIFVQCLRMEHSHPYHMELFQWLSDQVERVCVAKKRPREGGEFLVTPEKRFPSYLEMHGDLVTETYAHTVRSWRRWVSNGQWNETERAELKYLQYQSEHLALKIAVLLQGAIARIFRKEHLKAKELLKVCEGLCDEIDGDNYTFLFGRCKYTWSWLYRYLTGHDKAKKYTREAKKYAGEAMEILFNVGPGEDRALANYGYGSILVDCQANALTPNPKEMKKAESCLTYAISLACTADRGLEHIVPHSHLRLAQMYLGSTHYEPGRNNDPESIRKASNCLKAVDVCSLPSRSQCIFFLTESDLFRCKGDNTSARKSAIRALKIAKENCFETEVASAETKLKSLNRFQNHCRVM